jgi:hypothetical protein
VKRREKYDTLFEYLAPFLVSMGPLLVGWRYEEEGKIYLFKRNIMLYAMIPLLCGNCSRFVLYQVVKEKEINV